MVEYRLRRAAADDLAAIFRASVERFGRAQADSYLDGLYEMFDLLAAFPQAARLRDELDPPVRAHPHKSHIIIYEIEVDHIAILRIRHGHEDWQTDLF